MPTADYRNYSSENYDVIVSAPRRSSRPRTAQVDFASFTLSWGRRYALLVVLGYSRLLWTNFYARQTMQTLFRGLEAAFEFFGGVPVELLFDQMSAVITEDRRNGGTLVENAERTTVFVRDQK